MSEHTWHGLLAPALVLILSVLLPGCAGDSGTPPPAAVQETASAAAFGDLERQVATAEIERLKATYFRCLDTKDWACLETVFTPDAEAVFNVAGSGDLGTPDNPVTGGPAIAAFTRRGIEHLITIHHGHMPEIEITSPMTATGIWAMAGIIKIPDGGTVQEAWGHYHETYERIDGRWRIKTLRLTRLRVDRPE